MKEGGGGGGGEGRKEGFLTFLPHPLPALSIKPFFAWSLFFAPKRAETLATRASRS